MSKEALESLLQIYDKTEDYSIFVMKNNHFEDAEKSICFNEENVVFIYSLNKNISYSPQHKDLKLQLYADSLLIDYENKKNRQVFINSTPFSMIVAMVIPTTTIQKLPKNYKGNKTISNIINGHSVLEKVSLSVDFIKLINKYITFALNNPYSLLKFRAETYNIIESILLSFNYIDDYKNSKINRIDKINLIHKIIINRVSNPPSMQELSSMVGLNVKTIKQEFKKEYGLPVFKYLLNYKMNLAREMLSKKELNINEISSFLGYSSSSHFIFAFKKKFNITPKQFQKQIT